MAAYHRVYDSRHLQADCQEPGSALEPYARQSSMDYLYPIIPLSADFLQRAALSLPIHWLTNASAKWQLVTQHSRSGYRVTTRRSTHRTNISTGCETVRLAIRRKSMEILK